MKIISKFLVISSLFISSFSLPDYGINGYSCAENLMKKSENIPINVNAVRPADIDLVMAMGDSLTAGNGAGALNITQVKLQYRGLSFQGGGDKTLEEHTSLANILKKYNPNLFGYSIGIGSQNVWNVAQLNVAVPGAHAKDLPAQARHLISLLQQHNQQINITSDWKLLNIFIGANDVCNSCNNESYSPLLSVSAIKEAVQIIYDNVPRVIVSLTNLVRLEMLRDIREGICDEAHKKECHCVDESGSLANLTETIENYNALELELQSSGMFDKQDFTLVVQPFFSNTVEPPMKDGQPDISYFAPDCFHFSQLGHAIVSTHLWSNILQPVGEKDTKVNMTTPETPLKCPDENCPFIRTRLNSLNCTTYLNNIN